MWLACVRRCDGGARGGTDVTPDEIMHELGSAAGVPREALAKAVAAPDALRPRISELASKAAAGVWLLPDDTQRLVRGVVALAAAQDTASWPILREQEAEAATKDVCRRHGISTTAFYIYGRLSRCK